MKKNRIVALGLAAVMALSLTACGNNGTTGGTPTPTTATELTLSPEPTKEPADVESQLEDIHKAVADVFGEEYVPSMPYDAAYLDEIFGVKAEWYDSFLAEGPMMSMHVDTFIAVHAAEGNLENIQTALGNYQAALKEDTLQYPMNQLKIQGSRVETVGDYVFFIMLGFIDEMAYEEEEDMIAAYAELNQKAVDAIKEVLGE